MKKMALGAFLVLVLTIGFAIYYLLSNLDGIVKTAIETYGSQATQTTVRVESVQIGLKDGSGVIRKVAVGNPPDFAAPQAFSLGEIAIRIDLRSLSEEVTIIEQITVQAPDVFFELNEIGKNNLAELKRNLSTGTSATSPPSSAVKTGGAEPKLIIRKLLFSAGNIHARLVQLNKEYDLKLPEIELNNLGGETGATPTQIAEQVLQELTDRALAEVKKQGFDQSKAKLEGEVNSTL
jgi:hypothetical protein